MMFECESPGLGLVTLREMVAALVYAIEHPPRGVALIDVPGIRALARCAAADGPIASPREGTHVWP